jgi:two-component system NarL family response regulator
MSPSNPIANCKFVIAERSRALGMALRSILTHDLGAQNILEIETPDDLVAILPYYKSDFFILDIDFTNFEPTELITNIRHHQPKAKILILTANEDDRLAQEIIQQGVHGYCLKGLSLSLFVEIIRQVQQGQAWYDPRIVTPNSENSVGANSPKPKAKRSLFKPSLKELTHHSLRSVYPYPEVTR